MSYQAPVFLLLFFPLTLLCYQLTPQRHRWKTLLGASYLFFWSISGKLLLFLVLSTFPSITLGYGWIPSAGMLTLPFEQRKSRSAKPSKKPVSIKCGACWLLVSCCSWEPFCA